MLLAIVAVKKGNISVLYMPLLENFLVQDAMIEVSFVETFRDVNRSFSDGTTRMGKSLLVQALPGLKQ